MPALPLDQLQITHKDPKTGQPKTSAALNPEQKADRYFVLYKPPPKDNIPALVEEYLERANFVANDLDWLLALPHDKFWCQVIFDETLQKCLDSYLHYVPRKFDEWVAPTPEVADMQNHLHRSVFLTFLRMSTHKESKDHFISPSAFGEILYNNFLFDIPKILDLCVLFGKGNSPLLQKMIGNIFTQQPSYYTDLDETIPTILQVFSNILQHCGLQGDGTSTTPQKLGERSPLTPSDMPLLELKDIVLYLCDTSTTLWAFLDIFPLACQTFQKHDFCYRLASFYEMAIPELESAIKKRRLEDSKLLGDMWQRLSHSKKKLMEVFHIILNQICLLPILESSCDNIQGFIEEFLQIFSSLLQEKRFLRDYDTFSPVAEDISLLQQASSALDETRTAYILQAVESAWEGVDRQKIKDIKDPPRAKGSNNEVTVTAEPVSEMPSQLENLEEDEECMGAAAALGPAVSGVELDSLISQVKDLLPDLGEGFILACLEHYSYDSEQVINNILEDRLAPELSQLDRGLERQVKPDPTPLLSSRHNIFQNDEFDVFSRDSVDLSRVHKGRRKEENVRSLVNDKQAVVAQWQRYQKYSVVVEEVPLQPGEYQADDYEDEYDDTYDGNQVGANDADSDDELISRRPFTIPQVLRTKMPGEVQEEEWDEEDEVEEEAPKPDHFIQDPAVLREKAEARRMAFLARKGYRPENSTAVTGGPRGHGQSRETTQERRKKEANKAARANHNRRTMADRKRSKGMIPS
ncbi:activating signal cointegrator 1 complex subunit 2 isoform 1 [Mus musculus]|uniref:Activating signal cointegrator 1 complex subunit 2 n=3 Tax=Mus musculus TaxID=10090 RepID=ASCC2_MOUSE|nr:activating signal cointegrator 1 complex subunit 2 isoform 1 [Mus musculus]Q91WR3.1 RecName: Full=Activating signal cointegrator 1 complex subunit 2; AltName: Full=ASC-1 complex subunit p100; AltName: Full=Trip4 complex subunit p100 [Mus musculus]AAH13537.1 Activating signal cointegrator 1 complex subunit 2 [Mus musculus]EDL40484.1 activating signal cointegrator 1 complex subunit 2, isoform CRA_b [Mus musculus]|eukprot:NP_083567.1 activating signal cointegrator 1 complex subunit 2 [Mus musculus]